MMYVVTLAYFFKVIKLMEIRYFISGKRGELAKNDTTFVEVDIGQ